MAKPHKSVSEELSAEERIAQEREELREAAMIPNCSGCGRKMELIEVNEDGLIFVPFYKCPSCASSTAPAPASTG